MKNSKRILAFFLSVIVLVACLISCSQSYTESNEAADTSSSGTSSSGKSDKPTKNTSSDIKIKDIVWNTDVGIMDGERYLLMDLENKSPYKIIYFELLFAEKDGIDEEQRKAFLEDLADYFKADEDKRSRILSGDITMYAVTEKLIDSKETVSGLPCFYLRSYYYAKDANIMDFVQPDIATIQYVKDDLIYTVYYDYASEKFTVENETESACYWPDNHFADVVPAIEAPVIREGNWADDDHMDVDVLGISSDEFDAYEALCIEKGFTEDSYGHDGYYSAENGNGYDLTIDYDEESGNMNISVYYRDDD